MLNGFSIKTSPVVACLGVKIDAVKEISARCFYQLRQLWSIRPALTSDSAIMLIHALIASRVDYCNSVLFQTAAVHLRPLQLVTNAAAHLVVKKRKSDSIAPTLRDTLHWLLVRERIDFKLCLLIYKCLRRLATPCLGSVVFPVSAVSARRHLRSAGWGDLTVPGTRTVGFGPRGFSVAGPSLWNTLPYDTKQSSLSIAQFCSQLKSVMFVRSFYA